MGGPHLLYALSKGVGLPGLTSTHQNTKCPRIAPCIAFPTPAEVHKNFASVWGGSQSASSPLQIFSRRSFSILIDEVALEERLRYSIHEDAIIGFCREHSGNLDVSGLSSKSASAIEPIQDALKARTCHIGKEATVVALAPFGKTDYAARVVIASATCKTESESVQADLIWLVLDCWRSSPHGASKYGDIWSIATDGDRKRRRAIHCICMASRLSEESPLYNLLGNLPLINLYCGAHQETHDGDYKHEEKQIASGLRRDSGIFINRSHIHPTLIQRNLAHLEKITPSIISTLFDKGDHQNVPKAHHLLSLISATCSTAAIATPSQYSSFRLLGEFLGTFTRPYTDTSLSISVQLQSLSKCTHLNFALYRINRSDFLFAQLFYDVQASIKNVYFCVAKTKLLDPTLPFYLLQCGDDRLEGHFGTFCTMNHDSNMDLGQLCEHSTTAQHIDNIYAYHPTLNRAPYRLSTTGEAGVDHTNPASWEGGVTVGSVDLKRVWLLGRAEAVEALSRAGISFSFDQTDLGDPEKEIDLMRPFGEYVGLREDKLSINAAPSSQAEGEECDGDQLNIPEIPGDIAESQSSPDDASDGLIELETMLPPIQPEDDEGDADEPQKGWVYFKERWYHWESR